MSERVTIGEVVYTVGSDLATVRVDAGERPSIGERVRVIRADLYPKLPEEERAMSSWSEKEAYAAAMEAVEPVEKRMLALHMTLAHRLDQLEEVVHGLGVGGDHRDTAGDRAGGGDRAEEVTVLGDLWRAEESGMYYVTLGSIPMGLPEFADDDMVEVEVTIRKKKEAT